MIPPGSTDHLQCYLCYVLKVRIVLMWWGKLYRLLAIWYSCQVLSGEDVVCLVLDLLLWKSGLTQCDIQHINMNEPQRRVDGSF